MTRIAVVGPNFRALVLVALEAGYIVAEPAAPLDGEQAMEDAYRLADQVGVMFVFLLMVGGRLATTLGLALLQALELGAIWDTEQKSA